MASDSTILTDILSPAADIDHDVARRAADAILAAGFRPPARKIADPAEVAALAEVDMVALDRALQAWQCRSTDAGSWWQCRGSLRDGASLAADRGPLIVLYVPSEDARPEYPTCGTCGRVQVHGTVYAECECP